jgi:hypothetical protein
MSRLSLQVFYLWRDVLLTAPLFILWWSNLEILFTPLHRSSPFIGELCCQAIQTEHGSYIAERTQKAVYIVRCLWPAPTINLNCFLNPDPDPGPTYWRFQKNYLSIHTSFITMPSNIFFHLGEFEMVIVIYMGIALSESNGYIIPVNNKIKHWNGNLTLVTFIPPKIETLNRSCYFP